MTCWIYLVRHGATANNLARPPVLQGRRLDADLADEGRRQAERTAAVLAPLAVDAVLSGPLRRARQTAEILAAPHGLSVRIVEELLEVDVGRWEGLAWDVILREHPDAHQAFMDDAGAHGYLGGETLQDVQDRVVPLFERLAEEHPDRRLVVVGHNIVNRCLLAHLLGIPVRDYRRIPQDNCGVNVLRRRDGRMKLVTVNAVLHHDGT